VTPTRRRFSDREIELAGPQATPHRGAPAKPTLGQEKVVRHAGTSERWWIKQMTGGQCLPWRENGGGSVDKMQGGGVPK
jgi:hypothetical protein